MNISTDQQKTAPYAESLAHPMRVAILHHLLQQSGCYSGDLSTILPIAKSTLFQHLTELKKLY